MTELSSGGTSGTPCYLASPELKENKGRRKFIISSREFLTCRTAYISSMIVLRKNLPCPWPPEKWGLSLMHGAGILQKPGFCSKALYFPEFTEALSCCWTILKWGLGALSLLAL